MSEVTVTFELTPNPQSMKFNVSQNISKESVQFDDPTAAQRSPLATKVFGFPWASSVYLGQDFLTVTKQDWVDWDILAEPLCGLIREHVESGAAILHSVDDASDDSKSTDGIDPNDPPDVKTIKEVFNREIRPAVAMDGGDIIFHKYEDNVVYVYMQGACSGCPSSSMTLKAGIEARLKEVLPEVKEVVAL